MSMVWRLWWGWSLECRVERCVQRCGKASNAKVRTLDVTLRAMGATEGGSMGGTGMKIENRWDGVRLKAGRLVSPVELVREGDTD